MKNQTTVEFMIIFTIFLMGIAIVASSSLQQIKEINSEQIRIESENVLELISSVLDTSLIGGDGIITKLYLPDNVAGKDYTVILSDNFVILSVENQHFQKITLARNVTGSLKIGENTIHNINGILEVS